MTGDDAGEGSSLSAFHFRVDESEVGERLDRLLAARFAQISRSTFARWIDEGRVSVDGQTARRPDRPPAGARVDVAPAPPLPTAAEPEDIPLTVLAEDDDLLVIDKPAGLVVHPAPGNPDGTLVNAVLHHLGDGALLPSGDRMRPGIVHRLDKDTSGVMVVAKTARTRDALIEQFRAHSIERVYLAIVVGSRPGEETFDTLIGRHPILRKRFTTKVTTGKRAITHVRVLERLFGACLLECRLDTGRTHQIRVHLTEHGTPLLGDKSYGRPPKEPLVRGIGAALGRQALHAAVLGFDHPRTGERARFESAPPRDFAAALDALRAAPIGGG